MKFINSFFLFTFLLISSVSIGNAQTESVAKDSKTMACKVKLISATKGATLPSNAEIDKFLSSKSRIGIVSSKADMNKSMITVVVEKNFTEETLARLLEAAFKLEIEKYEIINLSK